MTQLIYVDLEPPASGDALIQAACTLDEGALRERLAEWIALRDRSVEVRVTPQGALLLLAATSRSMVSPGWWTWSRSAAGSIGSALRVSGATRELEIDAGPGGGEAVKALLSLGA